MALRPLLRFQNPDSTRDINDQSLVFNKGVFEGGRLFPVIGSLNVRLTQFATVGADGMFVREDDEENILSVVDGERNYIVLRSRYVDNAEPIVSLESLLESAYLGDPDLEFLILFGVYKVNVTIAVFATVGVVFATVYSLWIVQRAFFGRQEKGSVPMGQFGKSCRNLNYRDILFFSIPLNQLDENTQIF